MTIFQKIIHLFQYGRPNRPITRASLDEEVFAYRERNYGSYELRKNQPWYLLTATGIVMSALMCAVFVPIRMGWVEQDQSMEAKKIVKEISFLPPLSPPPIPCGNFGYRNYRIPKAVVLVNVSLMEVEEEVIWIESNKEFDSSLPDIGIFHFQK